MAPPIPTPLVPKGKWSAVGEAQINASAAVIYDAIVDTSTWPKWSTFVPEVQITSQPEGVDPYSKIIVEGTEMTFTVHMSSTYTTKSQERAIPVPKRPEAHSPPGTILQIGWIQNMMPNWLLRAQRINEITSTSDPNVCHYRTWETFDGPLVSIITLATGKNLEARFIDWANDLKVYCEKPQQGDASGDQDELAQERQQDRAATHTEQPSNEAESNEYAGS